MIIKKTVLFIIVNLYVYLFVDSFGEFLCILFIKLVLSQVKCCIRIHLVESLLGKDLALCLVDQVTHSWGPDHRE